MPTFADFYDFHVSTTHGRKVITVPADQPLPEAEAAVLAEAKKQYGESARVVTVTKSHRCPNCFTQAPQS
jgi:hypothetical protein